MCVLGGGYCRADESVSMPMHLWYLVTERQEGSKEGGGERRVGADRQTDRQTDTRTNRLRQTRR